MRGFRQSARLASHYLSPILRHRITCGAIFPFTIAQIANHGPQIFLSIRIKFVLQKIVVIGAKEYEGEELVTGNEINAPTTHPAHRPGAEEMSAKVTRTERGFRIYADFNGYGKYVHVIKSSSAEGDYVWIYLEVDKHAPTGEHIAGAHLTKDQAQKVIDALQDFIDGKV